MWREWVDVRVALFFLRIWVFANRREWNYNLPRGGGGDLRELCALIGPGPLCRDWQRAHDVYQAQAVSTSGYCMRTVAILNALFLCVLVLERSVPLLASVLKTSLVLFLCDLSYNWIACTFRYRLPFFLLRRLGVCHSGFRKIRVRAISLQQIVRRLSRVGLQQELLFLDEEEEEEEVDIHAQASSSSSNTTWLESFQHAADFIVIAACIARVRE